jgi:L-ascorbate metabolism protein UlaG (beta-lactamase superfamily)
VAHLGDLGHDLDDDDIEELGRLDVVLIPIGGTYTLDCQQASDLANKLQVKTVIPMHYRRGEVGFDVLQTLQEFLILRPGHQEMPGNELEITDDMPETTIVLNL